MLEAKDEIFGHIIPIETILEKFQEEKKIMLSVFTEELSSFNIDNGNRCFINEDYENAILQHDKLINNKKYF